MDKRFGAGLSKAFESGTFSTGQMNINTLLNLNKNKGNNARAFIDSDSDGPTEGHSKLGNIPSFGGYGENDEDVLEKNTVRKFENFSEITNEDF